MSDAHDFVPGLVPDEPQVTSSTPEPTMELRFVERDVYDPDECRSGPCRILQQKWRVMHFSHGVFHKVTEEWRDVPLVDE